LKGPLELMRKTAIDEYQALGQLAPGIEAWCHGDKDYVPRHFRVAPFWYFSIAVKRAWAADGSVQDVSLELYGPIEQAIIYNPKQKVELIGLAISPELARPVLNLRCDELLDHRETLHSPKLWKKLDNVRVMAEAGHSAGDIVNELSSAVCKILDDADSMSAAVVATLSHLNAGQGRIHLPDVSRAVGLSERHVRRVFLESFGCSPKKYARYMRLKRAISIIGIGKVLNSCTQLK
jgi:AraC-like DNA-binding protein